MSKIVSILLTILFIGSILLIPANEVEASEEYDYSYLEEYDYTMGNEYINRTIFNSVDFIYDTNYSKPYDPAQITDTPVQITRPVSGRFIRINNTYYKYMFDNTDSIKLFHSPDIYSLTAFDHITYQNKVETILSTSMSYSMFRNPVTFYENGTLYNIVHSVSNNNVRMYKGFTNGDIVDNWQIVDIFDSWNKIYPVDLIKINDTYYLMAIAYEDKSGPGINDIQHGLLFESNNLTGFSLVPNWTINLTGFTFDNSKIHNFQMIENNNLIYMYISYSNYTLSDLSSMDEMHHIIFNTNKSLTNISSYLPIYWENSTNIYSYNWIPIGNNIVRIQWIFSGSPMLEIRHLRGENRFPIDYNGHVKFYWNGLLEYNNMDLLSENLFDYVFFNDNNLYFFSGNESFPKGTYYVELNYINLEHKLNSNTTLLDFNLYIKDVHPVANKLNFGLFFNVNFINIDKDFYSFYRSNDDYFKYCSSNPVAIGVMAFSSCKSVLVENFNYPSVNAKVVKTAEASDIFLSAILGMSSTEKMGWILSLAGVITTFGAVLKWNLKYAYLGAMFIFGGLFLITGISLIGLLL